MLQRSEPRKLSYLLCLSITNNQEVKNLHHKKTQAPISAPIEIS
jgi:hypothetical protein